MCDVNRNCHKGSFHKKIVRGRRPPPFPAHCTPADNGLRTLFRDTGFKRVVSKHGRRPGAEFGRTKKFFRGPISGKMSIFRAKIFDDLFLVIDLVLRIFPFFSHIFRMFTMLNVVYDHFLTRKPPFFTLFILSRTSDNTTSQNIGGRTNAWAVPPPQIFGGTVPSVPPRSPPLLLFIRKWYVGN